MLELKVKKLHPDAKLPVCSHPGSDLAYDVFAIEDKQLVRGCVTKIHTGIALSLDGYGFLVRDRSSMASKGITILGGVIDSGYRGEIVVMLIYHQYGSDGHVKAGDKIAQLIPIRPATLFPVIEVVDLEGSSRGAAGFGSTDR